MITVPESKGEETAYDAVSEQAAGREADNREVPSAKMDWLYELELTDTLKRSSKKDNSANEAGDELFLDY